MPRARNIKPGFYKNEDLAECSIWARFIFPGLWQLADREGRLEDRPKRIKGELLAFDSQDVEPLLSELQAKKFILRYTNEDGSFIQILKFSEHQSPHYSEKQSVIKPPTIRDEPIKAIRLQEDSENPAIIKRGSQPPDSLNPDSLNPESLSSSARTPDIVAHEDEPSAALVALCRESGVTINPLADKHLRQFAAEGVTHDQLRQAIAIARTRKPTQPIPIGYLVPIVLEVVSGRQTSAQPTGHDAKAEALRRIEAYDLRNPMPDPWIESTAQSLGIRRNPGELEPAFASRVQQALKAARTSEPPNVHA